MSFEQAVNNLESTNADLVKEVVRVRDAAMGLNNMYPDVATGRQSVADGKYFTVPGDEVYQRLYRRNGSEAELIATYPSKEEADRVIDAAMGMANMFESVSKGLAGTSVDEFFTVPGEGAYQKLYRNNDQSADLIATYPSKEQSEAVRQEAADAVSASEAARDIALANANFIGRWDGQTGSLNRPASTYHEGRYWILLDNLVDVAAEEPGRSTSWSYFYRGEGLPFGPGPQSLIAGDMTDGFFGEVSAHELFTGDQLALILGVTEGTPQNSEAGWLKFARDNKIVFIAKQSFRHSISWGHIYARGLVYGTDDDGKAPRGTPANQYTTVGRAGNQFSVRLMTGAGADPYPESDPKFFTDDMHEMNVGGGSEWNRLIYRVHEGVPSDPVTDGFRADRHGGPQAGGNWENYSNSDLNIATGNGRYTWCQEQSDTTSSHRVTRGSGGVAGFHRDSASSTTSHYGWRPALELITNN